MSVKKSINKIPGIRWLAKTRRQLNDIGFALETYAKANEEQTKKFSGQTQRIQDDYSIKLVEMKSVVADLKAKQDETAEIILRQSEDLAKSNAKLLSYENENEYCHNFHDTILNSKWFTKQTLSPGRWAGGYNFLYSLYRVLDSFKPKSILETGLGQSTLMIMQYTNFAMANHVVCEDSEEWIENFVALHKLPDTTEIKYFISRQVAYKEEKEECIFNYTGFEEFFRGKSFDLLVIDGPKGYGSVKYSRIDILPLLPEILSPSFCIIIDDTIRSQEQATVKEIVDILTASGIEVCTQRVLGISNCDIIASKDNYFLTTM